MAGNEIAPSRGAARDGGSDGTADQPAYESAEAGTRVFLGEARLTLPMTESIEKTVSVRRMNHPYYANLR